MRYQTCDTPFLAGQPRAARGVACRFKAGETPAPSFLVWKRHLLDDALGLLAESR